MSYQKGATPKSIFEGRRKRDPVTDVEEMQKNLRSLERKRLEYEAAEARVKAMQEEQQGK